MTRDYEFSILAKPKEFADADYRLLAPLHISQ